MIGFFSDLKCDYCGDPLNSKQKKKYLSLSANISCIIIVVMEKLNAEFAPKMNLKKVLDDLFFI